MPVPRAVLAAVAAAALTGAAPAAAATPNDPLYPRQWGPQQVHAPQAWATSTGAGTVIAVVDSGVDRDHPDLAAKVVGGATFAECAATKPCGDGDWQSPNGTGNPHGTHVAGIAAASTGNGVGIAGVAPDAQIMPVKVLDSEGSGSFEDIGAGIRWAADHGADVINLSLGALPGVQALELTGVITDATDAIAYARSKNVVVVIAAGNESAPLCDSPAFNPGAICVTATDRNELHTYYSNLAVKPDFQVVAAPGGAGTISCADDIVSSVPPGQEGFCGAKTAGYDFYAGTSMATPHVAGVAALLAAQGRSDEDVIRALLDTARSPLGTTGSYDPVYGNGIVDAAAAVAQPVSAGTTGVDVVGPSSSKRGKGSRKPKRGT